MNVVSSYSWADQNEEWHRINIGLNWYDLVQLVTEKRVEGYHVEVPDGSDEVQLVTDSGQSMPLDLQFQVLQAQADVYVIRQRWVEGYPKEKAMADLAAIAKRVPVLKLK